MTDLLSCGGWSESVDMVNFTQRIGGSFVETRWTAALTALGVLEAGAAHPMAALVAQSRHLTELNEL